MLLPLDIGDHREQCMRFGVYRAMLLPLDIGDHRSPTEDFLIRIIPSLHIQSTYTSRGVNAIVSVALKVCRHVHHVCVAITLETNK